MVELLNFLKSFLIHRNLSIPDGRMLYSYQMNKREYQELQGILSNLSEQYHIIDLLKNKDFSNTFVLYAAEWWKREYSGGLWSWEPIFSSISVTEEIKTHQVSIRTKSVKQALQFWKYNNSVTTGKKYLGAIITNGGIPAKFLQTATRNASMIRVLSNVIQFATENDISNNAAELYTYVKNSVKKLPEALRNDEICELITKLVFTIIDLKISHQLQDVENPIAKLNRECPNWKDRFPLLMEDASIEKLLIGFVEKASRTKRINIKGKIPYVERLVDLDGNKKLVFSFEFPEFNVSGKYFEKFFNVTNVDIFPPTFYINNIDDYDTTVAIVSSVLGSTNKYKIRKFDDRLNTLDEVIVFLSSADNKISSDRIMLSQALDIAKPLVFTRKEDNIFVLRANESVSLAESECLIAYNDNYKELYDKGIDLGTILVAEKSLNIIKCVEDIEIDDFIVKLNAPIINRKIVLQGDILKYKTVPYLTYKGLPKLYYYDSDGKQVPVNGKYIKYYLKGTKHPLLDVDNKFGIFDIEYNADGNEKTYTVAVIPENAMIMFCSNGNTGMIIFKNFACYKIIPYNIPSNIEISSNENNTFLCRCMDNNYPDKICFKVYWELGGGAFIKLPYPVSGVSIYDENQRSIINKNIALKHLLGKKIRIFHNTIDTPRYDYYMLAQNQNHEEELQRHIYISDSITEIKLIDFEENIRNLLSYLSNEDAFVQVGIRNNGKDIGHVRVSKYDVKLEYSGEEISIPQQLLADFTNDQLENTKVYALPLFCDDNKLIELIQKDVEGAYTGVWKLDNIDLENKVVVIFSSKNSAIALKPFVIYNSQSLGNCSDIQQGIITNKIKNINFYRIDEFWQEITNLLADLHENNVPLTVFSIWQYICSDDKLLCQFLFKIIPNRTLFQDLRRELFIIPATIPMSYWLQTIQEHKSSLKYLDNLSGSDNMSYSQQMILEQIKLIVETFPEIEINAYYTLLKSELDTNSSIVIRSCMKACPSLGRILTKSLDDFKSEIFTKQSFNEHGDVEEMCWVQVLQSQNSMDEKNSWIITSFVDMYNNAYRLHRSEVETCKDYLFCLNRFCEFVRDVVNFPQICAFYAYFMNKNITNEEIKFHIKEFLNFNANYFIEVYKLSSLILCNLIENKKVSYEKK